MPQKADLYVFFLIFASYYKGKFQKTNFGNQMKYYGLIIAAFIMFLVSCSGSSDKDNFINTYKEILIVWGKNPDSAQAVPKVKEVLKKHGYTDKTFKDAYFSFARNPQEFMAMLDTARARADQEISKEKQKYRRE